MFWAYSLSFLFLWDSGGKEQGQAIAPMRSVPRLRIESGPAGLTSLPWCLLLEDGFAFISFSWDPHFWACNSTFGVGARLERPFLGVTSFLPSLWVSCAAKVWPLSSIYLSPRSCLVSPTQGTPMHWGALCPILFSSFRDELSCISVWHQTNYVTMDSPASEPFASTAWVLGAHICNAFSIFIQCLGSNPGFHVC